MTSFVTGIGTLNDVIPSSFSSFCFKQLVAKENAGSSLGHDSWVNTLGQPI